MVGGTAIEKAILDGVQTANKRYEKWSRGGWVSDSGVEGHVVSTIGEKLDGLISGSGSIEMEMSFKEIQKRSKAGHPPGRPRNTMKSRNRADIVVLTTKWRPICVIEVKRSWDETKSLQDLARIRDLILRCGRQNDGTLNKGFVAFLLEGWQEEDMTAEQCLKTQEAEIRRILKDEFDREGLNLRCRRSTMRHYPRKYRQLYGESDWVHASCCIGLWHR